MRDERFVNLFCRLLLTVAVAGSAGTANGQDYLGRSPRVPPYSGGDPSVQYGPPNQPLVPGEYATPNTVVPGAPYADDHGLVTHRVDDNQYWGERPLESFFKQSVRGASFRLDYLLWSTDEPGEHFLGAPTALTTDPRTPFGVLARDSGNQLPLEAILPNTENLSLNDTNGIRGIFSIPIGDDELRINAWALAQATDEIDLFTPDNVFITTTTFTNNQVAATSTNYDQYRAVYESQMWGGGINYVFGDPMARGNLLWKPLVGFRYLNVQEEFNQVGRVVNEVGDPTHTALIHSRTSNNIYGPSVGVELALEQPWFTFTVTPQVTFGLNDYSTVVRSSGIVSSADPAVFNQDEHVDFSAIFQVGAYFQLHVTENVTVFAGYDLIYASHVSRPVENIFYNERRRVVGGALVEQGDVRLSRTITDIATQGLTVGVVFQLP